MKKAKTIFDIHKESGLLPFWVKKYWWDDEYGIIVCEIQQNDKGNYAKGFSIQFDGTKMAFKTSSFLDKYEIWQKHLLIPMASKEEWVEMPVEFFRRSVIMAVYSELKQKAKYDFATNRKDERY